uniref:Retinol dehydrogenase 7-like n=1 Tax=Panagrellus redivivus TaxID=6233 RepID=A0A7E4WC84_PANRE
MLITLLCWAIGLCLAWWLLSWHRESYRINMKGRYVLISGCDSGFGRQLALRLLADGVNVFAGCFTVSGADSLVADSGGLKGKLFPVDLDITSQKSVDACFETVRKVLNQKNANLWGLVNNAGFLAVYGPMDWTDVVDYEQSINVNLLGAIRMSKKFTPLIKRSVGRIVTMISASGRLHGFYTAPYVTAKFGLEGYIDNLRLEMRPFGVKVSILEPGAFKTNLMNPQAMRERVESAWNKLDEDTKAEYGVQFKDNYILRHNAGTSLIANRNLDIVADAYIHALSAVHPRHRYVCGWDARLFLIPISFLASTWQDALIQFMMDVTSGFSKPAVLTDKKHQKMPNKALLTDKDKLKSANRSIG